MTKEQFWRIIEDVNAVSQNHDQETVWTRIVENLSHYPLEDIMDWHLIYHEYKDAHTGMKCLRSVQRWDRIMPMRA